LIRINLTPKPTWYQLEIARIDELEVSPATSLLLHVAAQLEWYRRQCGCNTYEALCAAILAAERPAPELVQ
jgi:hypothetical protein